MINKLKRFFRKEKGQGLVEYGLILALISVLAIGAVSSVGGSVKETFDGIGGALAIATPEEKDPIPVTPEDEDFEWVLGQDLNHAWDPALGYYSSNPQHRGVGYYKYIGDSPVIEIPAIIYGHEMTTYYKMFEGSHVKKVIQNNPKVTNMRYMFYQSKAEHLDLSELDTSQVTDMRWMFLQSRAKSVDTSTFDTRKVVLMRSMFNNSSIESLDLTNFDTGNVTNMLLMFRSSQATSIDVSSFNTEKVVEWDGMFRGTQVETIDLGSFDTQGATTINTMFMDTKATTGYARTIEDAARLNNSSTKPDGLTFIVKGGN